MKALSCPFLARVPLQQVSSRLAPQLLSFAERCPVMTHALSRSHLVTNAADGPRGEAESRLKRCPYLQQQVRAATNAANAQSESSSEEANGKPEGRCPVQGVLKLRETMIDKALNEGTKSKPDKTSPSLASNASASLAKQSASLHSSLTASDIAIADEANASGGSSKLKGEGSAKGAKFDYEGFFQRKLDQKKADNSYRVFRKVVRRAEQFPIAEEWSNNRKQISVWCSNDYLGLSWHPKVKAAVKRAVEEHGAGSGGTRNISGTSPYHEQLEQGLAKWHQKEAALLFNSCYLANHSTLYTLAKALPGCHILSDAGNHASMIQGIVNANVPKHVFIHNDPVDLERQLKALPAEAPKIVAFETVHSMTGAVCPLEELLEVTRRYGAISFIDEVHAVGLYGVTGAGIGERDGLLDKMDIISGTLGKAFGNIGGYVAASSRLIDVVRCYASGFIFTTSLPPTVIAGSYAALEVLRGGEGRKLRQKHQDNVRYLREELMKAGLPVVHCPSHIIPIHVGNAGLCTRLANDLLTSHGVYVQAINYPTVQWGQEKLRIAPTPHHSKGMMDKFVASLTDVWLAAGLELRSRVCPPTCEFCLYPIKMEAYESREKCNRRQCGEYRIAASA